MVCDKILKMWVNKQLKIKIKTKSFSDNYQKAVQGATGY